MSPFDIALKDKARELKILADYLERYPRDAEHRVGELVALTEAYERLVRGPPFERKA